MLSLQGTTVHTQVTIHCWRGKNVMKVANTPQKSVTI